MRRSDFAYDLPSDLIAQTPPAHRADGRLLVLGDDAGLSDRAIRDLPGLLRSGDLLIFNDSRVIAARVHGHKSSGGRVEVLIERCQTQTRVRAFVRASKTPQPGAVLHFADAVTATVTARDATLFTLEFSHPVLAFLERHGRVPLPPYIHREPEHADAARYQTVYARAPGSAAAPTAGLHFDQALLDALAQRGVERAFVTLHVGAGTFEPMRSEIVEKHRMHSEFAVVTDATCAAVAAARARGGRVIAVGTTALRTLESAARGGALEPFAGETDLFIYPPWQFQIVDALLTNFHLPESTLLMLVCALAGQERALAAYRHAVRERYRFFSYGDAMLIWPEPAPAHE